jgi:hypothetical protein
MKVKATNSTKDDPVPSHVQDVPTMNPKPRLTTKVPFKGGSHPDIPNLSFLLAFSNLEDEIPFKGGSLSHPKILECEINKIGTMYVCIDLNFIGN